MEAKNHTFEIKIGNITYLVGLRSSETAKESYEAMIRKAIIKEAKNIEVKPKMAIGA